MKKFFYDTMEVPASEDQQGLVYELFMSLLIILNAIAMIIGTVGSVQQEYDWILAPFEYFSLIIFSVEYTHPVVGVHRKSCIQRFDMGEDSLHAHPGCSD